MVCEYNKTNHNSVLYARRNSFGSHLIVIVIVHATGALAIASIREASTTNLIHRGQSSMKWASPTHNGCWLAQTNYDVLTTQHTTESFEHI